MSQRKSESLTRKFKVKAVLIHETSEGIAEAARDLAILALAVRRWVKQSTVDESQVPTGLLGTVVWEDLVHLR